MLVNWNLILRKVIVNLGELFPRVCTMTGDDRTALRTHCAQMARDLRSEACAAPDGERQILHELADKYDARGAASMTERLTPRP